MKEDVELDWGCGQGLVMSQTARRVLKQVVEEK